MTNNVSKSKPTFLKHSHANIKENASYLLSSNGLRGTLIAGGVLSVALVTLTLLLGYTVLSATDILVKDEIGYMSTGIIFTIIFATVIFTFPPIYCGMYNATLKASYGNRTSVYELFAFYSSYRMFFRSIRIFYHSFKHFYNVLALSALMNISLGTVMSVFPEAENVTIHAFDILLDVYFLYALIHTAITRKFKFISIPLAVLRSELSVRECRKYAKELSYDTYRVNLPYDVSRSIYEAFLAFLSIGILQVLYFAPKAIVKRTAYFRSMYIN